MTEVEVYLKENGYTCDDYETPSSLGRVYNTWTKGYKCFSIGLGKAGYPPHLLDMYDDFTHERVVNQGDLEIKVRGYDVDGIFKNQMEWLKKRM